MTTIVKTMTIAMMWLASVFLSIGVFAESPSPPSSTDSSTDSSTSSPTKYIPNDPKISYEVAICHGSLVGAPKEITVFRDRSNKAKATILYKSVSAVAVPFQSLLFSDAVATRTGDILEFKQQNIKVSIDLSSERPDKTLLGKWDNHSDLICKIITAIID